jgi:hypothetical protein
MFGGRPVAGLLTAFLALAVVGPAAADFNNRQEITGNIRPAHGIARAVIYRQVR